MDQARGPRICVLAGSFHPVVGGGEKHAFLLCRELVCQGLNVVVLTRRRTADLLPLEGMEGFIVHRVRPTGFARLGKYLMLGPVLLWLLRHRNEYDVIYVCGLRVLGMAGGLAGLLAGKPCVLRSEAQGELSGEFIWSPLGSRPRPLIKMCCAPLVRLRNVLLFKASAFLSISEVISQEYTRCNVSAEKIVQITNGIDAELFAPVSVVQKIALRGCLGLPDKQIFAYSGKLNRGKGLEMLLRVWARLAALRPDIHLVLVGSGGGQYLSCEDGLREYVRARNLESTVTFTGYVQTVHEYMQVADVFVFPSESEALGLALLEAMACEVPALASDIPGVTDIVQDGRNGRLVPAKNEQAWLEAMCWVLDHPQQAHDLATCGRRTVLERFSIAAVADAHKNLFTELAARGDSA